jgi:hypothetical protein
VIGQARKEILLSLAGQFLEYFTQFLFFNFYQVLCGKKRQHKV